VPESAPGDALLVERQLGEPGSFPGQFSYPRAMATDGQALWVVDKSARVQQIDPATGRAGVWWRMPKFDLGMPTGLTVAPALQPDGSLADALYVADTHYHRVLVYQIPGGRPETPREIEPTILAEFGSFGQGPGQFIYPTDIAVLTSADGSSVERIYVSEYGGNDRVSVFDAHHDFLFAFGKLGDGADPAAVEFSRPQSIVVDRSNRELILTDACNHRIGRFSLDGELRAWIGGPDAPPDAPARFSFPYGLDLLTDSTVLVTEFGGARVQRIDVESGRSLGAFGAVGRGAGQVATPWTALVLGRETYLLDSGNNRILVTRLRGVEGGHG
jgi:DNA-binding beta-propeller fold protein YncE